MLSKFYFVFLFSLVVSSCGSQSKPAQELFKTYTADELKADFFFFKSTLEKNHPRLYEFTSKKDLDALMDSIYQGINRPMNTMEFHYTLLPITTRIGCAHTTIRYPEQEKEFDALCKCPPFKLYMENNKAFIHYNFSGDTALKPGTEILSINGIPVTSIIKNTLARTGMEGIHPNAAYSLMNYSKHSLMKGVWDFYKIETYTLVTKQKELIVPAINLETYSSLFWKQTKRKEHSLEFVNANTAVLTLPMFLFEDNSYLEKTFSTLKKKNIANLIIDMRGNGGGPGNMAGEMLRYLMKEKFTYYNDSTTSGGGYPEYRKDIKPAPQHFTGNIYCLVDAGCFSSSGHVLSMLKYHKRATIIGEQVTAGYSCNSNGSPHTLPNTGLVLLCSNGIYETTAKGLKRADGILPDHEVKPTMNDVIANNDVVMTYALELIQKQTK